MCHLHFLSDGSVDAVVASKAIHNVPSREGRRQAIEEIVRVLKDGGQVAILDIRCIEEFAESLQACGIQDVHVSTSRRFAYPRLRTVTGKKCTQEAYA
jgi:ubiquinone/menaquinone biosynthesis C-methylase UbiE